MLLFSCQVVSDNTLQPHGLQHTRLLCHSLSPEVCSGSCMPYCSYSIGFYFQHQRHPSMIEHRFRFGLTASFFLELLVIALCSSPVAYWTPSDLGGSSSAVISVCLFLRFMAFSMQEYWLAILFLSYTCICTCDYIFTYMPVYIYIYFSDSFLL